MFFLAQAQSLLNAWTQGLVNYVNNVIQSFVHTTPPPAIQPGHPAYQIGAGLQAWLISLLIASNQAIYGYIAQNPPPNAVPTVAPTPTPGPTTTPTPSPTPGGVLANPSTLSFASVTAGQQFVSLSETYYTGSFSASATPANLVTLTASGNGFYVAPVNTGTGGAGTITFSDSLGNFINVPFTINQTPVPGNITFSPVSASLTQIGATQTVNILETNYSGGFTAVSGNTSVASVSVSGSQMTVTAVGNGNTNITVSNSGTQSSQFPVAVNSTPVIGPITLSPQTLTFNLPSTTAQPFTISDPGNTTGFTITGQSNIVTTSVSGSGASATVQVTPTGTAGTVTLSVADQAGTTPAQVVVSVNPVTLPNPSYTNTYPTAVSAGVPSYPVSIASVAFAAHSTITGEINGPANPAGSSMLAAPNGTATLFSLTGGQFNSSANTGQAAEQHAYDGEGAQQAFPSTDLAPGQTYLLAETTDGTYVYDFICAIPNASNNCAQYTTNDSASWTAGNYKLYIGVGADGTSRPALAGTRIFNINIYSSALNLAQINLLSQSAIADPYPAGPLTANPANLSFSNPTATAQTVAVTDPEFQGSTYTITSSNTSIVTVGSLSGSPTGSSFVATPQSAGNAVITIKDGTNTTTMTVTVAQQSSAFPSANWIPYPSGGPLQTDITTIYGTQAQELGTGTSSCGLTSSGWGAIQQTTTNLSCLHTNSANVINNMYTSQGSSPMAKIRIDLGQGSAWATYYDSTLPITGYLSGGPNAGNDTAAYYVNNDSNAPTMGMYQTGCES